VCNPAENNPAIGKRGLEMMQKKKVKKLVNIFTWYLNLEFSN